MLYARSSASILVTLALFVSACSDGGGGNGVGQPGSGGSGNPGPVQGTSVPAALVGSWYAGTGHTSAPYDPSSGSWGTPSGDGLVYLLNADGTYTKAFQSYYGNYGCTTGFTAFERGALVVEGQSLSTHPTEGHIELRDTCAPSANSDEPIEDLAVETFYWQLMPGDYDPSLTVLLLRRTDGAQSTFNPI